MLLTVGLLVLATCCVQKVTGKTRTYYLAAVEEDWNYAPLGNCVNDDTITSDKFVKHGVDRIGSVYRKILYREFKDGTFTQRKTSRPELGMLGPTLKAEAGDTIVVVFKNMAMSSNRSFSVHPHGVQYNKDAEGALYVDQTTGTDKADDGVAPGNTFRYVWRVPPSFAPTADDDACLPWAYHSHVAATRDVDSGLVGMLLTCKKGTLMRWGFWKDRRKDVSKEYPIYLDTTDENDSWLAEQNVNKCGDPSICSTLRNSADNGFSGSNRMSHVNGYVYGNLPGLKVRTTRIGKSSVFYFFSLNRGVSSVHFSGQVLTVRKHRVDSVTIFPATFVSAFMAPLYSGQWLMASRNVDTYTAGQQAYLTVTSSLPWGRKRRHAGHDTAGAVHGEETALDMNATDAIMMVDPELSGVSSSVQGRALLKGLWSFKKPRKYYLAIEDYVWDYGPSGMDLYSGGPLDQAGSAAATFFTQGPHRIGGRYKKTRYVEYTDSTFTTRKERSEAEAHLGMLGPVLMAEVGERVVVHVKNMANRPYSFLPHGVQFTKDNEGFLYRNPGTALIEGRVVPVGDTVTYRFRVPSLSRNDLPCVTRTYHSAVDPVKDINTGLLGPLLLCKRGQLKAKPSLSWLWDRSIVRHVSRLWFRNHMHMFLNFFTLDENLSWHLQDNINTFTTDPAGVDVNDPGFRSANRKHGINGRMFGNLEGLSMCRGDLVAWHLFGVGGEFDMHGVNFQGQTLELTGNHVNAKVVIPGTAMTLTSTPDTAGNWSVACRTNYHFLTGMTAKYEVKDCGSDPDPWQPMGATRRYYIAAQEVLWDYAPLKRDAVTGENFTDDSQSGYIYVKDDNEFIGSVYKKARYLEYTDNTFSTLKTRQPHQQHLGILGPVIQAEVGDVIEVVFFNNASRPYSIHPQGVQYDKGNEGANYVDGAAASAGDSVAPGQTFTYTWRVPERAGPGSNDPDCVAWMYYSSVNSVKDMSSGLVGPLVVCEPNILSTTPSSGNAGVISRIDVDREFWMLYYVFDENLSWYLQDNILERAPLRTDLSNADFLRSNRMNAINGLIYGNVEGLVMEEGDEVSWYLMGLGSSFDYHPVHFHGQTFTHRSDRTHRGDVLEVFPSTSSTVRMVCDNPGTWIVHCHFSDHIVGGMEATYTILSSAA